MNLRLKIAHPEHLKYSHPQDSIRLFLAERMPECIAGWCIVVGCKHPLRAVYGSDLRAAWALLIDALRDKLDDTIAQSRCRLWCWWHQQPPKAYWDLREIKYDKEHPEWAIGDDEVSQ